MQLNERAVKAIGLIEGPSDMSSGIRVYRHPITGDIVCDVANWSPAYKTYWPHIKSPGDYNHSHGVMYAEVVRRGLQKQLSELVFCAVIEISYGSNSEDLFGILDLTPAQLTKACCEVLEGDQNKED